MSSKKCLANSVIVVTWVKNIVLQFSQFRTGFFLQQKGSSISYVSKVFRKTHISYPLIRASTQTYQGVRNIGFSENFAYVLNESSHTEKHQRTCLFSSCCSKTGLINIQQLWNSKLILFPETVPFERHSLSNCDKFV